MQYKLATVNRFQSKQADGMKKTLMATSSVDNNSEEILHRHVVDKLGNDTLRKQLALIFQPTCIKWSDNVYTLKFDSHEVTIKLKVSIGSHLPKRVFKPQCVNFDENRYSLTTDDDLLKDMKNDSYLECMKEVFEPNKTQIQAMDRLYLEDFINASNFQIQQQLESLNLSVSVACSPLYSHEQFYETAVLNLKRTAPNLKTIGLYGTLRVYPRIMSLYELRKELMEIKQSMDAMSRSLKTQFESVEWIEEPMFIFAIDKEILKRLQASDLIKSLEIFNYSELELQAGKISLQFTADKNVQHKINILITALHPQGYSFY